ncbi:MAG: PAS domain-containing protein, partial [Candidatus Omnitrophica bacterium]|nr:PAS domain-containing protein [Candidatus Omnitrophota bacterium]
DFDEYVRKGQIEILPYSEWYLKGGSFKSERVLNGWVEKLEQAFRRGYAGLRLTGNTFWLEKKDWDKFTDYEEAINRVIGRYRMIAVCTYSLNRCNAFEVIDVVRNHQFALINRHGKWELIESSEHKQLELQLHGKGKELQTLLDSVPAMVFYKDKENRFILTNKMFEDTMGLKKEDFEGKSAFDLYPEQQAGNYWRDDQEVMATGKAKRGILETMQTPEGIRLLQTDKIPYRDEHGQIVGVIGFAIDVTERRYAEEAICLAHERLVLAQQSAGAGIWDWDIVTDKLDWSSEFFQLLGLDPAKVKPGFDAWQQVLHPDDRKGAEEKINLAIKNRTPLANEYRIIHPATGETRWINALGNTTYDRRGRPERMIGICIDITQRKASEELLLWTEQRNRILSESAADLLAAADPQSIVDQICQKSMSFLGCHVFFNFLVVPGKEKLQLNACAGISKKEARRIEWLDYGGAVCGCVARDGKSITAEDILHVKDPRTDLVRGYGVRAYCCHPLKVGSKVIGTISFGTKTRDTFEEREVSMMKAIADMVSLAIDRKQVENALLENQKDLNRAQAVAHTGSWRLDVRHNELLWSDENHRIFGIPKDTPMTYETFLAVVHPDDRQYVDQKWQAALRGGPYDIEHRIVVGKTVKWVRERAELEFDQDGGLIGGFGTTQDVSELKRIEDVVRRASEQYQLALNSAQLGTWDYDFRTGDVFWDKRCRSIFGVASGDKIKLEDAVEIMHVSDRDRVNEAIRNAMVPGSQGTYNSEYRVVWPDGSLHWVSAIGQAYFEGEGNRKQVVRFIGTIMDISERKQAEETIRKANEVLELKVAARTSELLVINRQLRDEIKGRKKIESLMRFRNSILKLSSRMSSRQQYLRAVNKMIRFIGGCRCSGIRVLDDQGNIPYEAYLGFDQRFWKSENGLSLDTDDCVCIRVMTRKPLVKERQQITKYGTYCCDNLSRFTQGGRKDSKPKYRGGCVKAGFKSMAVIPVTHDNRMVGAIHLADESEGKISAETIKMIEDLAPSIGEGIHKFSLYEKIQQSNELLERVFASTNILVAYLDAGFNFIRVNQAYSRADGRDPGFFSGKNYFELYPDEENRAIFKNVVETGVPYMTYAKPFVFTGRPESGTLYWDWSLQPVKNISGGVDGLVFCSVDVTPRKRAEEDLRAAQIELERGKRLSDIGKLAATVAHELRNPLGVVRIAAYNMRQKNPGPALEKHIAHIEKKVSESNQIINNLLFYSRVKTSKLERVRLYDILEECVESMKSGFGRQNVEVEKQFDKARDAFVEADPLQIKEVFSNILTNAFEAMGDQQGRVRVEVFQDPDEREWGIKFEDNGAGIAPEHLSRIREPFYTTKSKGTGLGLAVCDQIINLHKGRMDVTSQQGRGTAFTVFLPCGPQMAP